VSEIYETSQANHIEGQYLKKVILAYLIFAFVLMSFVACGIFRKTAIGVLAISTVVLFKRVNKLENIAAISEAASYVVPSPIDLN
jgi:hypothetical protein